MQIKSVSFTQSTALHLHSSSATLIFVPAAQSFSAAVAATSKKYSIIETLAEDLFHPTLEEFLSKK